MEAQTPRLTPRDAARKAARARWGPPRVLNLRDLSPEKRQMVLAFVEMAKSTDKAAKSDAA